MKTFACAIFGILLAAGAAAGRPVEGSTATADGILVLQPATATNLVAVRLAIPDDQMLVGIRWYNGSSSESFGRILAASGRDLFPPSMTDALVMTEDVAGTQNGWSSVTFAQPVASQTGALFVAFQYQANYVPTSGEPIHGIGYLLQEDGAHYFVSGNGSKWFKIASSCQLLIEPLLAPRDPSVVALNEAHLESEPTVTPAIPATLALKAYPNPFNPTLQLELALPEAGPVTVKVYDLRGRLVRRLHAGSEPAGNLTLTWDGSDDAGHRMSSGVYWARVEATSGSLTQRVVMIK